MLDITEHEARCFAKIWDNCTVLIRTDCEGCKFYKPINCEDWIRIDREEGVYLIPPEEYDKKRRKGKKKHG